MNNYPEWWNSTVTLYNKFVDRDSGEIKWFRTVLTDCFYNHTVEKLSVGQTVIESNVSVCRVRVNDKFVNKRVWNEFDDNNRSEHFTLSIGDIIVAGDVDFEVDEYTKGKRSSDLVAEYKEWPGCFTVETASINVGPGRGNEHYLARGV